MLVGYFEDELDPVEYTTRKIIDKNPQIEFMGYQLDVRPFLAASDVLVLPSYREGFPNVLLQAGAMGLPVIVTDVNGADEVIIEDYIGQKIDDIQKYNIDIFAIGSDWEGEFNYLNEYCKVVYLPRTEGVSSTQLRAESQPVVNIGIIGTGRITSRFVAESKFVNGVLSQEQPINY